DGLGPVPPAPAAGAGRARRRDRVRHRALADGQSLPARPSDPAAYHGPRLPRQPAARCGRLAGPLPMARLLEPDDAPHRLPRFPASVAPVAADHPGRMSDRLDHPDPRAARAAAEALADGGFVVLCESRGDESEANLAIAAQFVTPDALAFFSANAHGIVRLCLTDERCEQLGLAPLRTAEDDWQPTGAIAHRGVTGTGASTRDQARTIQAAIDPACGCDDFVPGGYVFPLRARPGGALRRAGRTEAAVDLARIASCPPAAALSLLI